MKHPIFVAAQEALERVEDELASLESAVAGHKTAADGAEQRLARLRKNEEDLNALVNGLAKQGAQARDAISKSNDESKKIIAAAHGEASNIIGEANKQKDNILSTAKQQAVDIVQAAKTDPVHAALAKAKDELQTLLGKVKDATDKHNKLKEAARAFAGD